MRINFDTFFNNYIVHPFSKELQPVEKTVAALSSAVFYVVALGSLHRRAWRNEKKIEEVEQDLRTKTIVDENLGSSFEDEAVRTVVEEKPKKTNLFTSQQQSLYDSLTTPVEKKLYETLHPFEGAFADLVLNIVKGRVSNFQVNENIITLNLSEGPAPCKLLGFELNANLPKELTLQHFPANREISFLEKIPFDYNGVYILTPESVTLSNQGVRLNADLSWATKLSGRAKFLEDPLSSSEVFKMFS